MGDERQADISMSHIPIRGGIGAAVLIAILLSTILAELPQLRGRFLVSIGLGLLFGLALILWRRRSTRADSLPPGAHTMLVITPSTSDEPSSDRRLTPPGAHPLVVGAAVSRSM